MWGCCGRLRIRQIRLRPVRADFSGRVRSDHLDDRRRQQRSVGDVPGVLAQLWRAHRSLRPTAAGAAGQHGGGHRSRVDRVRRQCPDVGGRCGDRGGQFGDGVGPVRRRRDKRWAAPRWQDLALSIISSGTTFGLIIAGGLALWTADRPGETWRVIWLAFAALAATVALIAYRAMTDGNNAAAPLRQQQDRFRPTTDALPLCAISALCGAAGAVFFTFAVDMVRGEGLSPQWGALLWLFVGVGGSQWRRDRRRGGALRSRQLTAGRHCGDGSLDRGAGGFSVERRHSGAGRCDIRRGVHAVRGPSGDLEPAASSTACHKRTRPQPVQPRCRGGRGSRRHGGHRANLRVARRLLADRGDLADGRLTAVSPRCSVSHEGSEA